MTNPPLKSTTDEPIEELEAEFRRSADEGRMACIYGDDGSALIARIRELERWKSEQLQVMTPVMEYAHSLNIAQPGHSVTQALIDDHKRLRELEEAQRWVPCSEMLPPVEDKVMAFAQSAGGEFIARWDGLHWGDYDDHIAIGYNVTHWKLVTPPCPAT